MIETLFFAPTFMQGTQVFQHPEHQQDEVRFQALLKQSGLVIPDNVTVVLQHRMEVPERSGVPQIARNAFRRDDAMYGMVVGTPEAVYLNLTRSVLYESFEVFYEFLAHELIHCDQISRGDLVYHLDGVSWQGEFYTVAQMTELRKSKDPHERLAAQYALPWEKEAYVHNPIALLANKK